MVRRRATNVPTTHCLLVTWRPVAVLLNRSRVKLNAEENARPARERNGVGARVTKKRNDRCLHFENPIRPLLLFEDYPRRRQGNRVVHLLRLRTSG